MLKQDARVALVAAALPMAACLPASAGGAPPLLASPGGAAVADAGGWRPGGEVSGLLSGAPIDVQGRASALRINGVALQWRAVTAPRSPTQLASTLGVAWRAVEQEHAAPAGGAGWLVLTRRAGNELHALQLRGDGREGSEGYWSVLDPTQPAAGRPRAPIAIPAGATVDSTIEQLDPAVRSTQYLGRARQSASSLAPRLRRAALAAGWHEQGPGTGRAGLQAYARGDELLELQVLPDGESAGFLLNVHAAPGARAPGAR